MAEASHSSIGEVLSLLKQDHPDITISKIRFLESQGLISPERTPSGYRKFYDADVERLRWILEQQRDNFLPLKVIKRRLDSGAPTDSAVAVASGPAREPTLFSQKDGPAVSLAKAPDEVNAPQAPPTAGASVDCTVQPDTTPPKTSSVAAVASSVSLTAWELADAVGVDTIFIDEINRLGIIEPLPDLGTDVFDHEALILAKAAAIFSRRGLEPRHLRMYKVAAERQAGVFEQLLGARARHNVESATEARAELEELTGLGELIQRSLMRRNLGSRLRRQ